MVGAVRETAVDPLAWSYVSGVIWVQVIQPAAWTAGAMARMSGVRDVAGYGVKADAIECLGWKPAVV